MRIRNPVIYRTYSALNKFLSENIGHQSVIPGVFFQAGCLACHWKFWPYTRLIQLQKHFLYMVPYIVFGDNNMSVAVFRIRIKDPVLF
jgi:hypothetical protein